MSRDVGLPSVQRDPPTLTVGSRDVVPRVGDTSASRDLSATRGRPAVRAARLIPPDR